MSDTTVNTKPIKPNYFEIFTRVLNELSWREVADFGIIEKPEHKRILNLINATNSEVLSSYIWDFQIEKTEITLNADETSILDNFGGKIISLWEGSNKYKYIHPSLISPNTNSNGNAYSNIGNLIIATPVPRERKLTLIYVSDCYAVDKDGNKKIQMSQKDDTSILPMPYLEPILVYGTLIRVKANPTFAKFGYWRTMYYSALTNLRSSGSKSYQDSPRITLG